VSDYLIGNWLRDFFLHTKHLNEDSHDADLGDHLLGFILCVEYNVELLKIIEFSQALINCLPQNIIEGWKRLKIFGQVVMRAALPWVGICVAKEGVH